MMRSNNKITVEVKNKDVFTAGDIAKFTTSFEILNPELVICHLDDSKTFLEIELSVDKGRGYLPAEESKPKEQLYGNLSLWMLFLHP